MKCNFCLNPESIITPMTCCTGCHVLKEKIHLEFSDVENMTIEEMTEKLEKTQIEILNKFNKK